MSSTFAGLSIAGRGLSASQVGMTVTTNNMSNIDTTGYSRQVVNQTSIGPAAVYSSNLVGSGADVTSVDRVRSFRLDQKYWQQNSAASAWEAKSTYLTQVESVFGSTDTNDISTALDEFNTELEGLANDPSSTTARAVVLEKADALCATLNDAAAQLTQLRSDVNSDVNTTVQQINSVATQIADLNKKISVAKAAGASTNELEDQQGVLVDGLSGLVGIDVTKTDEGILTITVAGNALVSGSTAKELECYTVTDTNSDQYGMYGIRYADTDKDFDAGDSGALSGYLELRDGTSVTSKGIPYYMSQLDDATRTFAQAFNEGVTDDTTDYSGHADGLGLNDTTAIRFFSYNDLSSADLMASGTDIAAVYQNITAANITVSKDITEDTDKIATASSDGDDGNNENIDDMISICEDANIYGNATLTDLYSSIIATVGTASAYATTQYDRTSARTTYIDTSRASVSGVSSDEETINLTKYQSAYDASATMVSAWSKIYETTINMVNT